MSSPRETPSEMSADACPKCGTELTPRVSGEGYKYKQCLNCMAIAQQLYVHRQLSDAQLDEKEARAKQTYRRTIAAIWAVRKERGHAGH